MHIRITIKSKQKKKHEHKTKYRGKKKRGQYTNKYIKQKHTSKKKHYTNKKQKHTSKKKHYTNNRHLLTMHKQSLISSMHKQTYRISFQTNIQTNKHTYKHKYIQLMNTDILNLPPILLLLFHPFSNLSASPSSITRREQREGEQKQQKKPNPTKSEATHPQQGTHTYLPSFLSCTYSAHSSSLHQKQLNTQEHIIQNKTHTPTTKQTKHKSYKKVRGGKNWHTRKHTHIYLRITFTQTNSHTTHLQSKKVSKQQNPKKRLKTQTKKKSIFPHSTACRKTEKKEKEKEGEHKQQKKPTPSKNKITLPQSMYRGLIHTINE